MAEDTRLNGLNEKLRYLNDEVNALYEIDVQVRRKAALNVGAWIYAIEQLARRFKNLNRSKFDAEVQPLIDAFCDNPTIDWWLSIRHKVIHDSPPTFVSSMHIKYLDSAMINQINQLAPAGTKGMFIGDELGGSGWEVEGEGGEVRKIYFNLPSSIGSTEINFPNPPDSKKMEELAQDALALTNSFVDNVTLWVKRI